MNLLNTMFLGSINKPTKHKHSLDTCSLLHNLFDIFKIFPRKFEISTNNGNYYFNKDLICVVIPIIGEEIQNNKDLNKYHFDIDDELNIMKKIESLFKGESVDFFKSEEKEIKKITQLFTDKIFTITLNDPNDELLKKYPEKMICEIDFEFLSQLLSEKLPKVFKIKTNKKEYNCNLLGILISNVISTFLKSNPDSTEYYFNFLDEISEFQSISDYFNFQDMKINSDNIDSLQSIAEKLEINPIIELINTFYDRYDENIQKSNDNQEIIEPYDEIFERLFKIKQIGIDEVAEFILQSTWVKSESEIQELAACFLHVINNDIFIHKEIVELIDVLSENQDKYKDLSILIPFLTNKIIQNFDNSRSKIIPSFLYHLYNKNMISIDLIIKKISFNLSNNRRYLIRNHNNQLLLNNSNFILSPLVWFYPELCERNLLEDKLKEIIQKYVPYVDSDMTKVEKMKKSRDSYVEKDSIIRAIREDDIDSLQSIVSIRGIDIQNKKIELPMNDNFSGEISFIDYAAACGSIKCFKYLFLNNASFTYNTFICSIQGGNVEIIRIIYQNKKDINYSRSQNLYNSSYFYQNPMVEVVNVAIKKHEYQIFDWLLDQNNFESEKDLITLFKCSIVSGNAHSMIEIIRKFSNLNNLESQEIYRIIEDACRSGFYKILKFLSHLIQFRDLVDPIKGDHSDLKDISNRRLKIRILNSELLKSSINYGMFSIFELVFNETGIRNSQCLYEGLFEAIQTNNLNVVKYILDNKIYELSPLFMIKAIKQSIEFNSKDVTKYFFQKEIIVTSEILQSACSSRDIELVKFLIQKAAEKQISLDFTEPFIRAVNSFSEDICRYFIEMKVSLNYQRIFQIFNHIIEVSPKMIFLLIENADEEIKDDILTQSINSAISSEDTEVLEYLFTKGIDMNGLLIQAIEKSDLTAIQTILNYNHSPEFINQIGPEGTALQVAVHIFKNNIVEYLLQLPGIDPNISIDSIKTPLVEAVESNNLKAVEMILKFYGESIKDQGYQIHNAFKQILQKQSNRIEANKKNLGFNFGMNHSGSQNEKMIFDLLLDAKQKLNPINMVENDLLSYAILEDDVDIVKKLLTIKSTNLKQKLKNGNTYLHLAIYGPEVTEIQKILIDHPDIDINSTNASYNTPLIEAVKKENIELVDLIVTHPKFDPELSQLDHAFFLSISSKKISRNLLKVKNLDVNYHSRSAPNIKLKTTPLMEAIRYNDIELAEMIINHPSFDPSKSKIKSCLFNSVSCRNLDLFRFLLKMNRNEINIKNDQNVSLLECAASIKDNEMILNEILNNENFDPVKSDIQTSFLKSNNQKAMKILISYDEQHGNILSLDKIDLIMQLNTNSLGRNSRYSQTPNKSHQYLLRKKGIIPKIHPFCTSVVSKKNCSFEYLYKCVNCEIQGICEICAKICHKGHEIQKMTNKSSSKNHCHCSSENNQCKCMSTQICSDDDEIYEDLLIGENDKNNSFDSNINNIHIYQNRYNNNDDNYYDYLSEEEEDNDEVEGVKIDNSNSVNINEKNDFDELRCSLDLSRYQPILQIMYHCNSCQVDVCQNCAIRCHKGHSFRYKGMVPYSLCHCKEITDCKCTDRKEVVCNYLFYGTEYVVQPWFKCLTCGTSGNRGCCALCSRKCHQGHNVHSNGEENAFCDCGANDLKSICRCMKLPPFNYLTCCTNRNQNYIIQKQRLYHCYTCGITSENQGICESCAIHCHIGHKVAFVGIYSFACECATVNIYSRKLNCIASLCPEMNYSGKCTRSSGNKDTVSGKYVCYTCNKEGKKAFCESCAVNCHKDHDVHFVEFSNFECQCDLCKEKEKE